MRLIEEISEAVMVTAFLRAEFHSDRFSGDLKRSMQKLNVPDRVVTDPNLADAHENRLREQLLGDYRGYKQNREIFTDFPESLHWYRAEIGRHEIGELRYVDYSYWNELTDHSHLVRDAVENIRRGKVVFQVSNDHFLVLADLIRRGRYVLEPIIVTGINLDGSFTILEGHVRATAFGLVGDRGPEVVTILVGLKRGQIIPMPA